LKELRRLPDFQNIPFSVSRSLVGVGMRVAQPARMNRRGFCLNACQIASLIAVGSLLEDCGGSPTSPSDSQPQLATVNGAVGNGAVTVTVAANSSLAAVGGAALVNSSAGAFLVAHVGQDTFNAMTAVCTHQQCTVSEFGNSTFQCPCHGSQFSTTGSVVRGPASQPLRRFNTSFANNVLTISL
jgi:cytochrome b6-f complex iron-sulfur subunit